MPYAPPARFFDIDSYNAYSEQHLGFAKFGYMRFMATEDSWNTIAAHVCHISSFLISAILSQQGVADCQIRPERYRTQTHNAFCDFKLTKFQHDSFSSIMYGLPEQTNKLFYSTDALSTALSSNITVSLPDYFTPTDKAIRDKILAGPEAYRAAMNWYRALLNNLAVSEEKPDAKDPNITVPVLSILEKEGPITMEVYEQVTEKFAKGAYRCERVSGDGHWVQLQCKDEVNSLLEGHFKEVETNL